MICFKSILCPLNMTSHKYYQQMLVNYKAFGDSIIHSHLLHTSTIDKIKCPKSYLILLSLCAEQDGFTLMQQFISNIVLILGLCSLKSGELSMIDYWMKLQMFHHEQTYIILPPWYLEFFKCKWPTYKLPSNI